MPTTFAPAPQYVIDLVNSVVADAFPELLEAQVTFWVQMAHAPRKEETGEPTGPALKRGGYPVASTTKITPLDQRTKKIEDVHIKLDGDQWDDWTEPEQRGIIDLAIMRVEMVIDDETGNVIGDDVGRPKMRYRRADFVIDGYDATVRRHRENAPEVRAAVELVKSMTAAGIGYQSKPHANGKCEGESCSEPSLTSPSLIP